MLTSHWTVGPDSTPHYFYGQELLAYLKDLKKKIHVANTFITTYWTLFLLVILVQYHIQIQIPFLYYLCKLKPMSIFKLNNRFQQLDKWYLLILFFYTSVKIELFSCFTPGHFYAFLHRFYTCYVSLGK